ncbi:hypothetical protein ACOSQ3_017308 [Xanthoceras sorbifolium]
MAWLNKKLKPGDWKQLRLLENKLEARKVSSSSLCPFCKAGPKTPVHALWSCCKLKPVRRWFHHLAGLRVPDNNSFLDLFEHCQAILKDSVFEKLCVVWWRVWFYRNTFVYSSWLLPVNDLAPWAKSFPDDFHAAALVPTTPKQLRVLRWEAPSPSWFKLNFDAAIDLPNKRIGIGVVIHDCKGGVFAAMASSLFQWTSLVSLLVKNLTPRSDVGLIIADLVALSSSFAECNFIYRPRSCNMVAHGLAKFGVNVNSPKVWFEVSPPCVEELIISDCSVCS